MGKMEIRLIEAHIDAKMICLAVMVGQVELRAQLRLTRKGYHQKKDYKNFYFSPQ